jgi:FtsZ-interacting cell division protein ZipA
MPIWGWILIVGAVAIVAVLLVLASSANRRKKTDRLKDRFGPEYERVVSGTGEQKAAEKELVARERKREKLDIRPLTAASLDGYVARWRAVQTAFVDHPASAVGEADVLVTEVMRERGYPVDDDFEQQAADISVDHPSVVNNYRAAHDIYLSQQQGDVGTEAQRQAFVHYRALFEDLLQDEKTTTKSQEASA